MSGSIRNTSQDPDYEGLPYHEKKLHKTHFQGGIAKKTTNGDELLKKGWIKIGVGRYKFVKEKKDG